MSHQERFRGRGPFYPNDPVEQRYHRDANYRSLVSMLEAFLQRYEFSPSELREAVMLAVTRNEMRICRPAFVLSDGEIVEFIARTGRDPKGEEEISRLKFVEALLDNPGLAAELLKKHEEGNGQ
jgi:hypothetical protein